MLKAIFDLWFGMPAFQKVGKTKDASWAYTIINLRSNVNIITVCGNYGLLPVHFKVCSSVTNSGGRFLPLPSLNGTQRFLSLFHLIPFIMMNGLARLHHDI